MLLTLYYLAATWIQSWRLSSMRSKMINVFSHNGSLVFYKELDCISSDSEGGFSLQMTGVSSSLCVNKCEARVGDLIWYVGNKRGCSIFPQQRINVTHWISFHNEKTLFPIEVDGTSEAVLAEDRKLHLLLEADYLKANSVRETSYCQLQKYGRPRAWKAGNHFAIILETDVDHLAKLGSSFMANTLSLDDGMELVRIESVVVEGRPCLLLNTDSIPVTRTPARNDQSNQQCLMLALNDLLRRVVGHFMSPIQWQTHVELLQSFSDAAVDAADKKKEVTVPGYASAIITAGNSAITLGCPTVLDIPEDSFPVTNLSRLAREEVLQRSSLNLTHSSSSKEDDASCLPSSSNQEVRSHPPGLPEEQRSSESFASCVQEIENFTPDQETTLAGGEPGFGEDTSRKDLCNARRNGEQTRDDTPVPHLPSPRESKSSDSFCSFGSASTVSVASHSGDRAARPTGLDVSSIETHGTAVLQASSMAAGTKPPNVLVFSESAAALENVKSVLHSTLHRHKYTIYPVTKAQLLSSPWADNTILLVVNGCVPDDVAPLFMSYLLGGGRMLCLCSDFLHLVLPTFRTAEVRERELVRFSYGRWRQVRMMHHIFCYQASPARSRFGSKEADDVPSNAPPKPPSSVEVVDVDNKSHTLQVQVLGAEETWHTPSLLLATVGASGGRVVFSQVHLEMDPTQYEGEESKFTALQQSEQARQEILQDLLSQHLGLECNNTSSQLPDYTPAYFLGRHELKLEFLSQLQSRLQGENLLKLPQLSLHFCGKGVEPAKATAIHLPVLIHSCPANFSTVEYFENLHSDVLGRLVLYSEVMTSSMDVLAGTVLQHGLAVVPCQQTKGSGRGGNVWLSPEGCAMFSIQLHIPLDSYLGRHVSFLQHIAGLAMVSAVCSLPGYQVLNLKLKWPNDVYVSNTTKIGGLIVTSLVDKSLVVCNVGCGINLSNSSPTTCINTLIEEHNQNVSKGKLAILSRERYLALVFTELERLLNLVQSGEVEQVRKLYYTYWLHSDANVMVVGPNGVSQSAKVMGVDNFGFLLVKGQEGLVFNVHPDGNSFDMLRGLVSPKAQ
ncbi:biotin--protein ligase [Anabrus simplex]|uniref:biotin--protein ligase n=1 Tax=Anabrus simplex TaxID=316456 RepID=UPI0035A3A9B8